MSTLKGLLPFLLAMLVATPVVAEPAPAPAGSDSARPRRFKEARAEILRKRLGLEEKRAQEVEKVLDRYAPERKKLRSELTRQQKILSELVKRDSSDQVAFQRALEALESAQAKLNALRLEQQAELRRLLTPKQQATLLEVMAEVRRQKDQQEP